MTGPVTTEALVDQIARILDPDAHHLGLPDYYGPEPILAGASARVRVARKNAGAILAGPLAPLLAALQQVTAERDEARRMHRWNIDRTGDGEVLVCRGYHDKGEDCDHERFVPEERLATATSELARLRAEGEAKDRALKILLPFVDYAAGEGLAFVETEDGEHPEMDAADIMAAAAEALGLELGSDAYLALLPTGYDAIRAARAATAREA